MKWNVLVPKYSHNASGFTRLHSQHDTEAGARREQKELEATGLYRFVVVGQDVPLDKLETKQ